MKTETFTGIVLAGHKEDAVEVPFDPRERWAVASQPLRPGRRGYPVRGTLNGCAFESAIVARSRKFWLLLPTDIEQKAGASVGDQVTIRLQSLIAQHD